MVVTAKTAEEYEWERMMALATTENGTMISAGKWRVIYVKSNRLRQEYL